MATKGVFERPAGSGVWWIVYYADGVRKREKVGKRSAAIALYAKRKTDILEGRKLPELRKSKEVTISDLINLVLSFTVDHKDRKGYETKARIVRAALGNAPADALTPQELDRWLRSHCKTPATHNRYKAFISLCYREGLTNGKVKSNPARLLRIRKENAGRLRFLSREEYSRLLDAIGRLYPSHLSEFVLSVHSGMRLSEQYSVTWGQVHFDRKAIELKDTKNGSSRTVHLNADAISALRSVTPDKPTDEAFVFPRKGKKRQTRSWFYPSLDEAKIEEYVWHSNRHTFCS